MCYAKTMNSTNTMQPMECTSTTLSSTTPPPTKLNNYDVILHHHTDTEPLRVARGTRHVQSIYIPRHHRIARPVSIVVGIVIPS